MNSKWGPIVLVVFGSVKVSFMISSERTSMSDYTIPPEKVKNTATGVATIRAIAAMESDRFSMDVA